MTSSKKSTSKEFDLLKLIGYTVIGLFIVGYFALNYMVPESEIVSQIEKLGYTNIRAEGRNNFGVFSSCGQSGNIQLEFSADYQGQKNINGFIACRSNYLPPIKALTVKVK